VNERAQYCKKGFLYIYTSLTGITYRSDRLG
jgi:hypothetical protein